jgi:hypothetical protein
MPASMEARIKHSTPQHIDVSPFSLCDDRLQVIDVGKATPSRRWRALSEN